MSEKFEPSLEKFRELLESIGWSLRHFGCGHYRPVSHKGVVSKWEFRQLSDKTAEFSFQEPEYGSHAVIGGPGLYFEVLDGETVSVASYLDKHIFILFPNYDLRKRRPTANQEGEGK